MGPGVRPTTTGCGAAGGGGSRPGGAPPPCQEQTLRRLRARDMTAGELADRFPLARSTLSGHFNVLKHAGLIVQERRRTSIVYSVNTSALEEALAGVMALM